MKKVANLESIFNSVNHPFLFNINMMFLSIHKFQILLLKVLDKDKVHKFQKCGHNSSESCTYLYAAVNNIINRSNQSFIWINPNPKMSIVG